MSKTFIFYILFLLNTTSIAQKLTFGNWHGVIEYDIADIDFRFNIRINGEKLFAEIINGEEIITLNNVILKEDSLFIELVPFDASLNAKFDTHTMTGEWKKGYRTSGIPFKAYYGKPRFDSKPRTRKNLNKIWQLEFQPEQGQSYPAIGKFKIVGDKVFGTFLTQTSDFRYFDGKLVKDSLILSSFDGAHAFKFSGRIIGDKISGKFYFDNSYSEDVIGYASDLASIPSPMKVLAPEYRIAYDILSSGNPKKTIDESKYFDKVLILQIFGTWCPNSMDQTRFLVDWYSSKPENVEMLAVTFEPNFSIEYGEKRMKDYSANINIPYDVILGGELSKGQAGLAIPYLDKINAFPTLLIIDKYGFIRYEFNYFNGPATGLYFENFKTNFKQSVQLLSKE